MDDNLKLLDKKSGELPPGIFQEFVELYRDAARYHTSILQSMSDVIFKWALILNAGGLAVTITFMGAVIKWHRLSAVDKHSFTWLIVNFSLGILFIVVAAFLEQKRFIEAGNNLEKKFIDFSEQNISAKEFMNILQNEEGWYVHVVKLLEKSSYILFFSGLIISVLILNYWG